MTISHTGIVCAPAALPALIKFYTLALAPLGYRKTMAFRDDRVIGFSDNQANPYEADWWVAAVKEGEVAAAAGSHHAFVVKDRATVEAFHKAALEAGGKDNGAPGVRTMYGPKYFAAFVLDPAGNNIEAMHNGGE
ncbi:Glyoxalase/bleomycin resistance protein/ dioxygenase [Podospora conica]|nr:Glyoxalase/bleomycin resistance protein/ dioxygenase [Schizothecium conicum]